MSSKLGLLYEHKPSCPGVGVSKGNAADESNKQAAQNVDKPMITRVILKMRERRKSTTAIDDL